ncbi:uncharacterized protein MELLADRAFT_113074 [Melampsora larici-populina 98AG31]|uniref:Uncharacterized protein n=1 Tax=Melampsora larici-populina (strain 98AG31 / pathotype 3-4-7) TaxID=747676 RepID=F4S8I5_MELLP|nr:uncharacterized protein MELLADRAFT_113074 [Melampsora larici-populina 98AG31]EGF99026.1 hypothetical protein MELLADRAFT_113074 [Melampsora larici-populina 98AG31]
MTSLTNKLEETEAKLIAAGIKMKKKGQVEGTSRTVTRSQSANRGEGSSGSGTAGVETNTGRTGDNNNPTGTTNSQIQKKGLPGNEQGDEEEEELEREEEEQVDGNGERGLVHIED